jgi:GNAT superfamily N-acetyltransferase
VTVDVAAARRPQVKPLSRVLGRAFFDDPVMMWMVPDAARRASALPRIFAAMTRHHFLAGDAVELATRDGVLGAAALWDPPGRWKTTAREDLAMMPTFLLAMRGESKRGMEVSELMKRHHPEEPHWYLAVVGSDPDVRGTGLGRALMDSRLDRCDAEGAPAYLESTKQSNVPYYLRFGFEVTGELTVPGGPTMWQMWRAPR